MTFAQMSFAGTLIIIVGVIIRTLGINRLPKKTFLIFWTIAAVRLLAPISIPFKFGVYSLSEKLAEKNTPIAPEIISQASNVRNTGEFPLFFAVWAAGVLISGAFFIIMYLKCCREFKMSLPDNSDFIKGWLNEHRLKRTLAVRRCDKITSPLTYGIFRPVILLPKISDMKNTRATEYVLEHEYTHIRRFDNMRKILLITVLCVHWFNPFVWIMYVLANRDVELICDEQTIRHFGEESKTEYAKALIDMEEKRSKISPAFNSFSRNAAEERIVSIMKFKKASFITVAVSSALIIGTTAAFATSADNAAGHNTPDFNTNCGHDFLITDFDENKINAAKRTDIDACELVPDENGNYTSSPDDEADMPLNSGIQIYEFSDDGADYTGFVVNKDSRESRISEEQMKKYINEIENGNIKPIGNFPSLAGFCESADSEAVNGLPSNV